jgi:hypothetical protein
MSDVTGKDLIKMGFSPSPWFGEALREIGERRLSLSQAAPVAQRYVDDVAKSEAERRARERPLHATAPDWRLNITAESEAEQANLLRAAGPHPHGGDRSGDAGRLPRGP